MAVSKDSPHRRRSIAVTNQNNAIIVPRNRRRAHSVVPGDHLSPLARSRRSLGPRKSILKTTEDPQTASGSSSQTQPQSQGSANEDSNITQSMDITTDFRTKIHDNTSRKSFGRRVSFAEHAHVRLFDSQRNNHANGSSPQSSASVASSDDSAPSPDNGPPTPAVTDENAYPAAQSRHRRRSSIRQSIVSEGENMDLTTVGPSVFAQGGSHATGSAILDEEFEYSDEYDNDDMEVTEMISGDFIRKRSLSLGGARKPLMPVQSSRRADEENSVSDDNDRTQLSIEDDSQMLSDADSDQSRAMEFTIPLNQSLRPPAQEDEVWLALRQATHSGDTPIEPEPSSDEDQPQTGTSGNGMDLNDAMQRLMRARDSLSLSQPSQETNSNDDEMAGYVGSAEHAYHEDSITTTEDSFNEDDDDDGNRTINVSKVLGRVSLGGPSSLARMSMGYQEMSMDESEIYGSIAPVQSTPRPSVAHLPPPQVFQPPSSSLPAPTSNVFKPPPFSGASSSSQPRPSSAQGTPQTTVPVPSTFAPKAPISPSKSKATPTAQSSPSKLKPKPAFSAAFAPPVSRPSPKKTTTPASADAQPSPKRTRPSQDDPGSDMDIDNADKPTPSKRQALAGKWLGNTAADAPPAVGPSPKPKPLSPSKKAPFLAATASSSGSTTKPASTLRRPSGYYARRKSLAVGLRTNKPAEDDAPAPTATKTSLKKRAGLGLGRASMGSASTDAWMRFDATAGSGAVNKGKEKENIHDRAEESRKEEEAAHCVKEAARQAVAAPSPTRGLPAPASPRVTFAATVQHAPSPSREPVFTSGVDLSSNFDSGAMEESPMDSDATEQWREGIQADEFVEDDAPAISIEQFFAMTGIKFMDELTAPRRSVHQPSRQARSPADIPLAEYVTAIGIDMPQLVLYSRVSKDLQGWMEKSKTVLNQAEEEAAKVTPELFVEYSRADEEGQAELLHQLNLIRTNTRGLARSDWYDWKLQWVEGLRITADKAFGSLEQDAIALEGLRAAADDLVPSLEKHYEEIMIELEKEKAEVAEIEASDQDYLNELKASIAEQNIEVEALQAEVKEGNEQLRWLQERLEEIGSQKDDAIDAIAKTQRVLQIQESSTRSEVFRLKEELEALEDLHMFRTTKVTADLFEYIYASQFRVTIPCKSYLPVVMKVNITRLEKTRNRYKDDFPSLSRYLLESAKQLIVNGEDMTVRQIVHRLGGYWSSCAQMRSQLKLLSIKYPVEIEIPRPPKDDFAGFKVKTMVMFPSLKAKASILFFFSTETFSKWPLSMDTLHCEVDIAYGPIDGQTILEAVKERLSQATPSDNYACLLDACIEAQDVHLR